MRRRRRLAGPLQDFIPAVTPRWSSPRHLARLTDLFERIARGVADEMGKTASGTDRFVLGSIGPGTKLPSLGHTTFAVLRELVKERANA